MPLSERLTLSISPACCSMVRLRWDYAEASLLRHGDGEARLGYGVHCGGHERGVEGDFFGELCLGADLGGDYFAEGGNEEYVVECQGFGNWGTDHNL